VDERTAFHHLLHFPEARQLVLGQLSYVAGRGKTDAAGEVDAATCSG
jgi:hypothetical protein